MTRSKISQEVKMDVLKEIGNIGMGNATSALSQLLNYERIDMEVPYISLCLLEDIPEIIGGADEEIVGVFTVSPSSFYMIFMLRIESASQLVSYLTRQDISIEEEMGRSVLLEVGNIITASYLNSLSYMTGLTFLPTPPSLAVDMAGAILGTVLAEASVAEDHIMLLKTALTTTSGKINGHLLIIPDSDSLDIVVKLLIDGASK